jgi:hypothetical protein
MLTYGTSWLADVGAPPEQVLPPLPTNKEGKEYSYRWYVLASVCKPVKPAAQPLKRFVG